MDIPYCTQCETHHQPQEPHYPSPAFAQHIRDTEGRQMSKFDTIAHTRGLIREAGAAALQSKEDEADHVGC